MDTLIGNSKAKATLQRLIDSKRIGQSLLFAGPPGVGKFQHALAFARALLPDPHKVDTGNHPDLHILQPEGKTAMHTIDSLRRLAHDAQLPPNESPYQIFLIDDAERMLPTSANALLKTFEEPTPQTLIILISSDRESLLPTILSRCRTLYFSPIPTPEIAAHLSHPDAKRLAHIARGSLSRAIHLSKGESAHDILIAALGEGGVGDHGELVDCAQAVAEALAPLQADPMEFAREIQALCEDLTLWYRDLHLLKEEGDLHHLFYTGHVPQLEAWRGPLKPLNQVESALISFRTSVARFTKLETCLETLFLRLAIP